MKKQELEYRLLLGIHKNSDLTQRSLALDLGVSLGRVNFMLKSLSKAGLVKLQQFRRSDNKMGYFYLLTPKGVVEMSKIAQDFLERKEIEYINLRKEIEQIRAEIVEL